MPGPGGYGVRAATHHDLDAVESLTAAVDEAQGSEPTYRRDEIVVDWERPGFDMARDSWLIESDGGAVAFGHLAPRGNSDLVFMMWIHPEHHDPVLADTLIERMDARGREIADVFSYKRGIAIAYEDEHMLRTAVQEHGFSPDALFVEMVMSLEGPVRGSPPLDEIRIRTFEPDNEAERFYEVLVDAFAEHWGAGFPPFEEWWRDTTALSTYDPYFSLVAFEGDEMVGALFSTMHEGLGEVHDVGVLRKMRGRGIGEALMLEAFKRFRERGGDRARLWVDTQNVTSAIKLYERVGMTAARRMHFYAKSLA